ncbi:DUF6444 domain-containing protein [Ktedonobacter sp. SOSP1-52]|uniref:DUF6444 domain-containing protein n=1 Tax=Ktedonobacter sp. SOSP1-52 TaxID=2778366 RepID=UPI001914F317|nr:DUF6444 domain-containing protein [Ktedonobacter sp. SOSP1-52]
MRTEEDWQRIEQENQALREMVVLLQEQVQHLQGQVAKTSRNSHLPPSSDRFVRQPKSLRKSSGKKPGGQAGHEGNTLFQSADPDEIMVHPVLTCEHCHADLRASAPLSLVRARSSICLLSVCISLSISVKANAVRPVISSVALSFLKTSRPQCNMARPLPPAQCIWCSSICFPMNARVNCSTISLDTV